MQPWFGATRASARLQHPAAALLRLLLSLSASVGNVLDSSHDSFLFAFDRVLLPFPGRKRRPPESRHHERAAVSFFPFASFSLEPESIHQPAGSASLLPLVPPSASTTKPSVPMSVSGAACSNQNTKKQTEIDNDIILFVCRVYCDEPLQPPGTDRIKLSCQCRGGETHLQPP